MFWRIGKSEKSSFNVPRDRGRMLPYTMNRNSLFHGNLHTYDRCRIPDSYYEQVLQPALNIFDKGAVIVDVCSGVGEVAQFAQSQGFNNVLSIDISLEGLKALLSENPQAVGINGCGYRLPLADSSVDIVHIKDGLVHFEDQQSLIVEQTRILKPGGILIIVSARSGVCRDYYQTYEKKTREEMIMAGLHPVQLFYYAPTLEETKHDWYGKNLRMNQRPETRFVLVGKKQ